MDAAGTVTLLGQAIVHFAASQSSAIVHISFCPPLAQASEFSCEAPDQSAIRARTSAA